MPYRSADGKAQRQVNFYRLGGGEQVDFTRGNSLVLGRSADKEATRPLSPHQVLFWRWSLHITR